MSKILHLFDISPHIYAGSVNKKASFEGDLKNTPDGWQQMSIPTGGIAFLFNKIYELGRRDTLVFAADRTPTNRIALYPPYKGHRDTPPEIAVQKEIVEEILQDCGFQVFAEEGFEADDILYALAKRHKNDFDHIYVHTGDSDIYSLVNDKVSILPSSSRAKTVTLENYETTVDKKRIVRYNGVNFLKWIEGDKGDSIPPLQEATVPLLWNIYNNTAMSGEILADPDIMGSLAEEYGGQTLLNFKLVYPWDVPGIAIDLHKFPDLLRTQSWGKAVGNSSFKHANTSMREVHEQVASFFDRGLST